MIISSPLTNKSCLTSRVLISALLPTFKSLLISKSFLTCKSLLIKTLLLTCKSFVISKLLLINASLVTRLTKTEWHTKSLFETRLEFMKGHEPVEQFSF